MSLKNLRLLEKSECLVTKNKGDEVWMSQGLVLHEGDILC